MTDNDDYMVAKATNDTITELMWDRLQEGINANRRYRLKGVAGGNNIRYSSTKVVWDSDIYIYFTRESDGAWVYNKINANPTTGITCGDNDLLYVILNDTTTTVLTVSSADYTSMLTDDTGRILILGAIEGTTWYGNSVHHTKYALLDDLIANEITVIKAIDDASIDNAKWDYVAALSESPQTHMSAANPHSGSGDMSDLIDDQSPQLYAASELDLNNGHISLNATSLTAGKATGFTLECYNGQGASLYFGDFVYVSGTSGGRAIIKLADADSSDYVPCIGMVAQTIGIGAVGAVLVWGMAYHATWNWVPDSQGIDNVLYLSTTAGDLTQTAPSGANDIVQAVGIVLHADKILVNPSLTTVKVT